MPEKHTAAYWISGTAGVACALTIYLWFLQRLIPPMPFGLAALGLLAAVLAVALIAGTKKAVFLEQRANLKDSLFSLSAWFAFALFFCAQLAFDPTLKVPGDLVFALLSSNATSGEAVQAPLWSRAIVLAITAISITALAYTAGMWVNGWVRRYAGKRARQMADMLPWALLLAGIALVPGLQAWNGQTVPERWGFLVCLIIGATAAIWQAGREQNSQIESVQQFWFQKPIFQVALAAALSLLVALALHGEDLRAQLGVIDDHEIFQITGYDGTLSLQDFGSALVNSTELGSLGENNRFRTVFSISRVVGALLWGAHPFGWYAMRLLYMALFTFALWHVTRPLLGFLNASLFALSASVLPFWSDIISRLAAAENNALPGLALFLLGFSRVWTPRQEERLGWVLLTAGTIVSAGSKENMVLLELPLAVLGLRLVIIRRFNWKAGVALALSLAWVTFIVYGTLGVVSGGTNLYGQSTSLSDRLAVLMDSFRRQTTIALFLSMLAAAFLWGYAGLKGQAKVQKATLVYVLLTAGVMTLFIGNIVFYNGEYPTNMRYDFPGMLFFHGWLLALLWLGYQLVTEIQASSTLHLHLPRWIPWLTAGLLLGMLTCQVDGIQYNRLKARENAQNTALFNRTIQAIADQMQSFPDAALVLETDSPFDEEVVRGYSIFLRVAGMENPVSVRWTGSPPQDLTGRPASLAEEIVGYSQNGGEILSPLRAGLLDTSNCFSFRLSGTFPTLCPMISLPEE